MREHHLLDKQKMLNSFNSAATDYEAVSVLQQYTGKELLDRLQIIKLAPKMALDLGAGIGINARELSSIFSNLKIIQLDIAENMLRKSRNDTVTNKAKYSYICADAEALPIAKNSVDLAVSNLMLQWSQDPDKLFADLHSVVRPGGVFIFSSLGPDTLCELRESWAAVDNEIHVNVFLDMHDIGDSLVRAGFADPVMEVDKVVMTYKKVADLMNDLKELGANNVNIDRRKSLTGKNRLLKMQNEYEKKRINGLLPATYEVIYGHAWLPAIKDGGKNKDSFVISLASLRQSLGKFTSKIKK